MRPAPPEQVLGLAPGLVRRDASETSDDDPLVGRGAPAVAGTDLAPFRCFEAILRETALGRGD